MFGWCMWYLRGREKQSTIGVSTALISSMKKTVILRIEGKGRRRGKGSIAMGGGGYMSGQVKRGTTR